MFSNILVDCWWVTNKTFRGDETSCDVGGVGRGIFLEVAMVDHGHHVRACTRTESADPMLLLHCCIIRSSWMRYSCVNSTHKPSTLNLTVMVVHFHKGALNIKNSHWLNFIQCHTISFRLTDCFINLLALYYSHWLHMFVRTVHTAVGCSNWMNLITVYNVVWCSVVWCSVV